MSSNKLTQFGLILPKKKQLKLGQKAFGKTSSHSTTKLNERSSVFDDVDDERQFEELSNDDQDQSLSALPAASSKDLINQQLQKVGLVNAAAEKEKQKALKEDPTVFDYDGVYDEIKSHELQMKKNRFGSEEEGKKSKYIEGLMKTAERRKIELERIRERRIQKERELEGDLYGDKEKFVTEAYKAKQEELKRIEEEEQKRQDQEEKNKDITGFYKTILNQSQKDYTPVFSKESRSMDDNKNTHESQIQKEQVDEDERIKKELIRSGKIALNDSEEVVDKRQLLSAGLNVSKRKIKEIEKEKDERKVLMEKRRKEEEKLRREKEENERKRRKVEEDAKRARLFIEEQKKKREDEEQVEKEEQIKKMSAVMARKADEKTVSDAKARYLARKRLQKQESSDDSD